MWWSAVVLANLGDGIRLAAFPLLAAQLTHQPLLVGAVAAAGGLPWLLTGLLAGSLADRVGPRRLLPLADTARGVVLAGLIALLVSERAGIAAVLAAAFLLGVAETVRDAAAETVVPLLVNQDQLERAGGRLTAGSLIGNEFAGPLLGGLLFGAGAVLPFITSSAATALAVLLVLTLPAAVLRLLAPLSPDERTSNGGTRAGLQWLRRQRVAGSLVIVVALVALADSAWFAVFVLYTEGRLGLGPVGFGALLALGAGGGLTGALLADRLVRGRRHNGAVAWSSAVATASPALLLLAPALWAAGVVVVVSSAAFGILNVAAAGLRYRLVPRELLGRVSAAWRTSAYAASAGGALAGGLIASTQGLSAPFVLSVAIGAIATALWLTSTRTGPTPA
jgi:MFS family permease